MEITATMVKDLRALTGAGVLDCRKALDATGGDFDKAAAILRDKGQASAAKKSERAVNEGMIGHYIHTGSKVAAMVEVNCESDFVARTERFQQLIRDLSMQVVASRPTYVRVEEVPAEVVEGLRQDALAAIEGKNRPANVVEQVVNGKLAKYYSETCLLEQPFIKDESIKVKELVSAAIAATGENIVVRRFARLEVGG